VQIYSFVREKVKIPILAEVDDILKITLQLQTLVEIPLLEGKGS